MYEFETTRWGRFQNRFIPAFLLLLLLFIAGLLIWFVPKPIQITDGFSILLFSVSAPFMLWFFLLFHRAFTSATLTYYDEGVVYRTFWGQRHIVYWTEVIRAKFEAENRDVGPVEKYFYDGKLDLYWKPGFSFHNEARTFPLWPRRISVPIFMYARPEQVLEYVAYALQSSATNQSLPQPSKQNELMAEIVGLIDESDRLKRSRHINREMRARYKKLSAKELAKLYWKVRQLKYGCIILGCFFLCCPLLMFPLFDNSLEFMRWKTLTLRAPLACGFATLILAAFLASESAAIESAFSASEAPSNSEDVDF